MGERERERESDALRQCPTALVCGTSFWLLLSDDASKKEQSRAEKRGGRQKQRGREAATIGGTQRETICGGGGDCGVC